MRAANFNWSTGIFVITYHVLLLAVWPFYFAYTPPSAGMWVASVILFFATGLSITAGYHRFYSHQTYKAHPIIEGFLLFFGSMAAQGSALRWSYEHRIHHAYVDTDRDPYSIKKGFWYAHILWLFHKPNPIENKVVADLQRNPLLVFQHKHYAALMFGTNILAFLFVGWLLNDYLGALVLAWWSRLFLLHHSTWFINSLAHTWGARTFSKEQSAVDNYVISLLTFGEGYHNYHHTFANDYRNGIRWYHFDPTKWLIWFLNHCGLTSNLKRVNQYHVKERMVAERKEELLEAIQKSPTAQKEELTHTISTASEEVTQKLISMRQLLDDYNSSKDKSPTAKHEINSLKKSIKEDWKRFGQLYKNIMRQYVSG